MRQGIPVACSLTPGGASQRVDEFDRLFAHALTGVEREPRGLRLLLAANAVPLDDVMDLLNRERACCPFYDFDVTLDGDAIRIEVGVPDGAGSTLDTLEAMARDAIVVSRG